MILLWILLTAATPNGEHWTKDGLSWTRHHQLERYGYFVPVTEPGGPDVHLLETPGSHFSTTKTVLLQKDLTTGVDVTTLHPLLTNLGQELQPSLRNLDCSYQTTLQQKDALHVDWQRLQNPLHESVRFTN